MIGPLLFVALLLLSFPCWAQPQSLTIGYLGQQRPVAMQLGPLDQVATDEGLQGARLAIADNNTTGKFIGQEFSLAERILKAGEDPAEAMRDLAHLGVAFVVADVDAKLLLRAAEVPEAARMVLLNSRAPDDELRGRDCRMNVLHTIPSRAMLADALAQYLVWKRWPRWFLLAGQDSGDEALAVAYRRAAKRFGAEIVQDRPWRFRPANGRADTGHVTLQSEVPAATRAGDYDVLVVADEGDAFGAYLEGRTAMPRPVVGTQGLVVTGWSAVTQQWGATQLQSRFEKLSGRRMTAPDYAAWVAVRSVGEGATRTRSADPATISAYLRGSEFLLAGFKGQGLSFRLWDGQLRQPILIAGPRLLVSSSPQEGFLHQRTPLDTLGVDLEESQCRF